MIAYINKLEKMPGGYITQYFNFNTLLKSRLKPNITLSGIDFSTIEP